MDEVDDQRPAQQNMFLPLVEEAYSVLRRAMHNSNDKLSVQTAKDILDYAGQKKEATRDLNKPIIIRDSQVQILMQVLKESLDEQSIGIAQAHESLGVDGQE